MREAYSLDAHVLVVHQTNRGSGGGGFQKLHSILVGRTNIE